MDKRQKALEAIKEQIRQQRARIDPDVLRQAQAAAEAKENVKSAPPAPNKSDTVPYDKKSAQKSIELFLAGRTDRKGFIDRLNILLKNTDKL